MLFLILFHLQLGNVKIPKHTVFYYTSQNHRKILQKLNRLFPNPTSVPKIQSSHAFIPCDGNKLQIKRFSNAKDASFMQYLLLNK